MKFQVFVVDDDRHYSRLLSYRLSKNPDYDVQTFNSGEDALAHLEDNPDLVLLDLLLPDISGWEVLRWVRARRDAIALPVLIITAYGGDGDELKAYEYGANGFMPKPFDPPVLRDTVTEMLGGCPAV